MVWDVVSVVLAGIGASISVFAAIRRVRDVVAASKASVAVGASSEVSKREHVESTLEYVALEISQRGFNEGALADYFNTVVPYVDKAQTEIYVLDYLPPHNALHNLMQLQEFEESARRMAEKYRRYFETLEERLDQGISYTRVLQLPYVEKYKRLKGRKAVIQRAVDLVFRETLEHFERIWSSESRNSNFKLYILSVPVVPFSYMLIDEKYILAEYMRRNLDCVAFPGELFTNRADIGGEFYIKHARKVIDHRKSIIYKILYGRDRKAPVEREEVVVALKALEAEASENYRKAHEQGWIEKIIKVRYSKEEVFAATREVEKRLKIFIPAA